MIKICTKCRQTKPVEEFSHSTKSKDGYTIWCKECLSKRYRSYMIKKRQKDLNTSPAEKLLKELKRARPPRQKEIIKTLKEVHKISRLLMYGREWI